MLIGVCAFGIFCQFWQFSHRQSFWKDETGLARNFLIRDLSNIHQPLTDNQAAPMGFLQLSKLMEMALGHSEHVFWLLPLLIGALGILAAAKVWKNLLPTGAWVIAVALWALNPTLISHITQFKPYLTDAVVALVLTGAFYYYRDSRRGGPWIYLLAGLWALWMSYTSVFVLAGFGLWMAVESWRRTTLPKTLRVLTVNGVLFGVFVFLWMTNYCHIDDSGAFKTFWQPNFAPLPWESNALAWWGQEFGSVIGYLFGQTQWLMWVLLVGLGIAFAIRHNRRLLILLIPVGLTIIASLMRLYPIYDRLELFWAALLIPFAALGIYSVWRQARDSSHAAAIVLVLCVALPYIYPLRALPAVKDPQELKQTAVLISHKARPGQVVYIHPRANELYRYYFKRYPVAQGVTVIYGDPADAQNLYGALKQRFAGAHLWVMFTEPMYVPDEIAALVVLTDKSNELMGMADFNQAGALELQLQ